MITETWQLQQSLTDQMQLPGSFQCTLKLLIVKESKVLTSPSCCSGGCLSHKREISPQGVKIASSLQFRLLRPVAHDPWLNWSSHAQILRLTIWKKISDSNEIFTKLLIWIMYETPNYMKFIFRCVDTLHAPNDQTVYYMWWISRRDVQSPCHITLSSNEGKVYSDFCIIKLFQNMWAKLLQHEWQINRKMV